MNDIRCFLEAALERGLRLRIEKDFMDYLDDCGALPEARPAVMAPIEADAPSLAAICGSEQVVAISIGGDGTFLRTARRIEETEVPVLGINTGNLGFLSHYTFGETDDLLTGLLSGDMRPESREVLQVEAEGMPDDFRPYALNEVALLKEDTSSMICSHVSVDGRFLADYLADGVLISTPTGSTGYNLSVGGPIVQPSLQCMVITPVASHSLTQRPLVIGGESVVELITTSRAARFRLSLDGCGCLLEAGTAVTVRKAPFAVNVLLKPEEDFATPLRNKLLWGIH